MKDRFDYEISTQSQVARDHYVEAVDLVLAAQAGIVDTFEKVVEADPSFALGYVGLARGKQYGGSVADAKIAMEKARTLTKGLNAREQSHLNAFGLLIDGKGPEAYSAIRSHVDLYPRDALVAQTCSSVFGLIGFSGKPGREAEMLAYNAALLPHYGEEWWCLSQYAFSLCETGNVDKASTIIDKSLSLNPRNANGAHVLSHVYYEMGETQLGKDYLDSWLENYDRAASLYGHLSWHSALWSLERGEEKDMWHRIATDIHPSVSLSLPINTLTDMASILYRAELAGVSVPKQYWIDISAYAQRFFPKTSLGFIDIHAALAHAMCGEEEALRGIIESPNSLTGDLVTPIAEAYKYIVDQKWEEGVNLLSSAMSDHARLGGSRAQRDVLEFSLLGALLKLGKTDEARRILLLRRPVLFNTQSLFGMNVEQRSH